MTGDAIHTETANTSNIKRASFLFGAGAVIDWGGPKTLCNNEELDFLEPRTEDGDTNRICCITHMVMKTGFRSKTGERITKEIFLALLKSGYNREEINFEMIINVIEECIIYYANYGHGKRKSSFISAILDPKPLLENFLNYKVINKWGTTFQLEIPGVRQASDKIGGNNQTEEQFFFQLLLIDVMDGIHGHVSQYGCYTENIKRVVYHEANKDINECFGDWIQSYANADAICRMYTLNYDRIFRILSGDRGLIVIEGFTSKGRPSPEGLGVHDKYDADIQQITAQEDAHCHFNLHGCSDWTVFTMNEDQLQGIKFRLEYGPHISSNDDNVVITQVEKGKSICVTSIITGYQKTQKTAMMPFKQMQSAFDRDCIKSDILFIIGYSFGDEHINESIKAALQFNRALQIVIVDCGFINNKIDQKYFDIISVAAPFVNPPLSIIDDFTLQYPGFNTFVHLLTFKQFLTSRIFENYKQKLDVNYF